MAHDSPYSKDSPFAAKLLKNINLSGENSGKEIRHFEISLSGSGLNYEVGDALGVVPANEQCVVDELLAVTGFNKDATVVWNGKNKTLQELFFNDLDITALSKVLVKKYQELTQSADLLTLINDPDTEKLTNYVYGRDLADLIRDYPCTTLTPEGLVSILRKIPPRLYSIASSIKAHPEQVHLTVGIVRYDAHGRKRNGVCSSYLSDRIAEGKTVPCYVHSNPRFRLPADSNVPVIMVGPGTGIAPFRAFLEERKATSAKGKNWLFFGDRSEKTDFIYRDELEAYQKSGLLTHLSLAWSRDQAQKIYVQNKMLEQSKEFYAWLQAGAYFYICGDASRMAKDVHQALIDIVCKESSCSPADGEAYIKNLVKEKRYLKDVY